MSDQRAEAGPVIDVFFWVQHLLGIGHLTRAATLVRAMDRAGLTVTLVSGGVPTRGLDIGRAELLQLQPLQSDGIDFKHLLDRDGRPADEAFKASRRDALLSAFHERRPRLVLLEMFPFGRRQMRFELDPLIAAVKAAEPRPLLVSSVRDILVRPPKPQRLEEMIERAGDFDLLMAHGDPTLVPFARTFPDRDRLGDKLVETGYVVEPPGPDVDRSDGPGAGEIVVSTGGGRVGEQLLATALEASRAMRDGLPWRLLVGDHLPEELFAAFRRRAGPNVTVERARSDFRNLLARAALSISQGGYNTVMEVLAAGCPAVVVPYAGGLETEQTLRCRLLAERGFFVVVDEASLSTERLISAANQALAGKLSTQATPRMDGVAETVRRIDVMLRNHYPRYG